MRLQGHHHITTITADTQTNDAVDADVLGLRLVKKTVNFDASGHSRSEPAVLLSPSHDR
jgi:catechol 2,3-dioxygenase-like lactoylglutathione lyase family enzyme